MPRWAAGGLWELTKGAERRSVVGTNLRRNYARHHQRSGAEGLYEPIIGRYGRPKLLSNESARRRGFVNHVGRKQRMEDAPGEEAN